MKRCSPAAVASFCGGRYQYTGTGALGGSGIGVTGIVARISPNQPAVGRRISSVTGPERGAFR